MLTIALLFVLYFTCVLRKSSIVIVMALLLFLSLCNSIFMRDRTTLKLIDLAGAVALWLRSIKIIKRVGPIDITENHSARGQRKVEP
jgi:hypothetical protein